MTKAGTGALIVIASLVLPARAAEAPALPWAPAPSPAAAYARAAAIAELGRKLFFDPALSASGTIACATCHDPAHGFAAPNPQPVQSGGADLRHAGVRSVPGLSYAQFTPAFREHFFDSDDDGDESADQGPAGGLDRDGRVDRTRDQAAMPLFDPNEMAMPGEAAVAAAVANRPYAAEMQAIYGQDVFSRASSACAAVSEALEFYQQTPAVFSPFSSKYDAFLRGAAVLSEPESRGLAVFNDPARGDCARCHKSAVTADGKPPLFTDFGFAALGLPRNPAIPANRDPSYFDLGLCGPYRRDLAGAAKYCGMFKAPGLRNVALKQSFYHNGIFRTLRQAVAFYAERDSNPAKYYPPGPDGTAHKFDDLPAAYYSNVETGSPFGDNSRLSDADVDDLVAFLGSLTDGYAAGE